MNENVMGSVVADFLAESDALDRLLTGLSDEQWLTATPAAGWDVRDSVTHVAVGNDLAGECARTGRSAFIDEVLSAGSIEEYEVAHLQKGRTSSPDEVLDWWRGSVRNLADALGGVSPDARLPWGPNMMSAVSFTTARLMETWAHGLDCFDAVGAQPVDTVRLRHVAHLALRALPYAFGLNGAPAPGPVRLELAAPDGAMWRLGSDDAPTVIRGTAGDWCRVAVRRDRRGERARLQGNGPDADAVVANVQAYLSA